jgi:hypothetical protein
MDALYHHAYTQTKSASSAGCGKLASALTPKPLRVPAFLLRIYEKREPTSGLEPLTSPLYE